MDAPLVAGPSAKRTRSRGPPTRGGRNATWGSRLAPDQEEDYPCLACVAAKSLGLPESWLRFLPPVPRSIPFFDISEFTANGASAADITLTMNYAEGATLSGPAAVDGSDTLYYVAVDFGGTLIYPGGQPVFHKPNFGSPRRRTPPTSTPATTGRTETCRTIRARPPRPSGSRCIAAVRCWSGKNPERPVRPRGSEPVLGSRAAALRHFGTRAPPVQGARRCVEVSTQRAFRRNAHGHGRSRPGTSAKSCPLRPPLRSGPAARISPLPRWPPSRSPGRRASAGSRPDPHW